MNNDEGKIGFSLELDDTKLRQQISNSQRSFKKLADNVEADGTRIDNAFSGIGRAVASLGAAWSMQSFAKKVAEVRGEFQKLEVAFQTMLGSKAQADALMQQLIQTAATTPFGMTDIAGSAKQLLAYGLEAEKVNETLIRLGDIAAGLSIPINDLAYLYGTTMVQGRLYTQDLNQFLGRGIPLAEELAAQLGVTKAEVKGLVEEGKVGFPQVQNAIENLTGEGSKFGGLMEAQSKTIAGQISNLGDSIEQMFNEIGRSSQDIISGALGAASSLVENYERVGRAIFGLVGTYGAYRAAVMVSAAAVKGWTIAELAHYNVLLLVEKAQKLLNRTMLANPYVLVATAVAGLVAVTMSLKTETERIREAEERYNEEKQETIEAEKKHLEEMNKLCDLAAEEAVSTDDRRKALVRLRQEYPSILDKYKSEEEALRNIKRIKQEIAELEGRQSVANPRNELKSVEKQIREIEWKRDVEHDDYWQESRVGKQYMAKLKQLQARRAALQSQIRQDDADSYFANLTGISNKELAQSINVRRALLAKMDVSGRSYGVIGGNVGVTGRFDRKALEGQLQSLEAEYSRRNQPRHDPRHYASEAKKRYDAALKAYNDFLKSKHQYSEEEYKKERDRLKAELDAAKKEYDRNKPAGGSKPKQSAPPKANTDDTAERERKEREEAERELARSLKDMQTQNADDLIALREDETERKLAQIDRDWQRQKVKIEEQAKEWKELNRKLGTKTGDDGLTADQREAAAQAYANNDTKRTREEAVVFADDRKAQLQAKVQALRDNLQLDKLFGDLDKVGTQALQGLQQSLEDFIQANAHLDPSQMKDLAEALERIKNEVNDRRPFARLKETISALKKTQEAYNKAVREGSEEDRKAAAEKRHKALSEANEAKNAALKEVGEYMDAARSVTDSLESMGVNIPESIKGAMEGLDDVLGGLESIDLTKPASIITGTFKIIGGFSKIGTSLFGSENREWERLSEQYKRLSSIYDELIDKKQEYISMSYGQEVARETENVKKLLEAEKKGLEVVAKSRLDYRKKGDHSVWYNMWKGRKGHEGYAWKDIAEGVSEVIGKEFNGMEDLIGLTEEQWEELVKRYPEYVANLDADFLNYLNEIRDKEEAIKEAAEAETEKWTGFTADSMLEEFLSSLQDMDKAAEDFAEDFEGYLKRAVINSVIGAKYKGEIEQLVKDWESMMKNDGRLDEDEVEYLKRKQQDLTDRMLAEREEATKVFGDDTKEYSQEASRGAFQTMSQETGDELNGRFTAIQMDTSHIRETLSDIQLSMSSLHLSANVIKQNTDEIRNISLLAIDHLEAISKNTHELYEMNQRLGKIEKNTRKI